MSFALLGSLTALLALGCWDGAAPSVRAQCLVLDQMVSIAAAPNALAKPQDLAELPVSEWAFKGGILRSHDVYWASARPAEGAAKSAVVMLRVQQRNFDVVLKTVQATCLRQMRGELKALGLKAVNVTCPNGCEAQRYDSPDFQATLYSKMKGDHPFVVVLHPLRQAGQALPPAAKTSPRL